MLKLRPFGCVNKQLSTLLGTLESHKLLASRQDATRALIELANAMQPFLATNSSEEGEEDVELASLKAKGQEALVAALAHIQQLEEEIVRPTPPPVYPPPPPDVASMSEEKDSQAARISSLERQLLHVQKERDACLLAQRTTTSTLNKKEGALRQQVEKYKKEAQENQAKAREKERALVVATAQLCAGMYTPPPYLHH